jgi:hypothetical protein
MTLSGLRWPTKEEYDLAIQQWQQTVLDPDVRGGTLAQDAMGISAFGGANLYVTLYKIGNWMIRCFCSNPPHQTPPDIVERYRAIDRFCRTRAGKMTALLPSVLVEQGIKVGERIMPFVKMPFLAGTPPLGEFIADHYTAKPIMLQLRDAWQRMIYELEAVPMAHGDLDLTNVLVEQRGSTLTLKLIDYDNIWIPELASLPQTEYGHAAFQHPAFFTSRTRRYTVDMDRFSALVIYIALDMLAYRPELYDEWHADESEQLLFSEADYLNFQLDSSHINQLRKLGRSEMRPYTAELIASLYEQRMPSSLPAIRTSAMQTSPALSPQGPSLMSSMAVAEWGNKIYNGASAFKPVVQPGPVNSSEVNDDPAPAPVIPAPSSPHTLPPAKSPARTRLFVALFAVLITALIVIIVLLILTLFSRPSSALALTYNPTPTATILSSPVLSSPGPCITTTGNSNPICAPFVEANKPIVYLLPQGTPLQMTGQGWARNSTVELYLLPASSSTSALGNNALCPAQSQLIARNIAHSRLAMTGTAGDFSTQLTLPATLTIGRLYSMCISVTSSNHVTNMLLFQITATANSQLQTGAPTTASVAPTSFNLSIIALILALIALLLYIFSPRQPVAPRPTNWRNVL